MFNVVELNDRRTFRMQEAAGGEAFFFQTGEDGQHIWTKIESVRPAAELGFCSMRAPLQIRRGGELVLGGEALPPLQKGDELTFCFHGRDWFLGIVSCSRQA